MQIIISGPEAEAQPLIKAAHSILLPQKTLIRATEQKKKEKSILYQKLEILANIPTDQARAYLCKNFACSEPVSDPESLIKLIREG